MTTTQTARTFAYTCPCGCGDTSTIELSAPAASTSTPGYTAVTVTHSDHGPKRWNFYSIERAGEFIAARVSYYLNEGWDEIPA